MLAVLGILCCAYLMCKPHYGMLCMFADCDAVLCRLTKLVQVSRQDWRLIRPLLRRLDFTDGVSIG